MSGAFFVRRRGMDEMDDMDDMDDMDFMDAGKHWKKLAVGFGLVLSEVSEVRT